MHVAPSAIIRLDRQYSACNSPRRAAKTSSISVDDDGLHRRHLRPLFAEKSAETPSASAPVAVASTVASDSSSVAKTVRASASASASAYANSASAFIADGHSDSENPEDLRSHRRDKDRMRHTWWTLCMGQSSQGPARASRCLLQRLPQPRDARLFDGKLQAVREPRLPVESREIERRSAVPAARGRGVMDAWARCEGPWAGTGSQRRAWRRMRAGARAGVDRRQRPAQ